MKKLGQKLLVFVIGSLIVDGICYAVTNVVAGRDIFGNKYEGQKNKVDILKRVHLGTENYSIE